MATLIRDNAGLRDVCRRLNAASWLAFDTEFMRASTYYARLCLVQLATPDLVACVDPLAVDIKPLLDLLYSPRLLKVIHAARQDLEVLSDLRGAPPAPVFDTQIAAALAGYDEQIGYASLVEAVTTRKLAKLHTRADWEARPLSTALLQYAEDDVRFLRDVYVFLEARLEQLGRREWLEEECAALVDPALYRGEPTEAYRRIRQGQRLGARAQLILRELAAWRECTARARNLPRGWVLADPVLVKIADAAPATMGQLAATGGMGAGVVRKWGHDILQAVDVGRHKPAQRLWPGPKPLTHAQHALYEKMIERVQAAAGKLGISPALLAKRRDIRELIRGGNGGLLLRGWRRQVVGAELEVLRAAQRQTLAASS